MSRSSNRGADTAWVKAALASAALITSQNVCAFEWNGLVGFGVWGSDNETRSSTTRIEETTYEPVIGLSAQESTPTLQLDASYQAQRRIFRFETFEDQTVTTGNGSLLWTPLPNRFDLTVLQNRTEGAFQTFAAGDQGTRQVVSTTEATPRLRFRTRSTDELQLSYRYRYLNQEFFDIESETNDFIGRYQITLSDRTELGLEYTDGTTTYEVEGAPELNRQILQATYSVRGDQTDLQITGGQSVFTRAGRDDADGFTGNLLWTLRFGNEQSLNLSLRREITDGGGQFLNRGDSLDPVVPGVQPGNTDLIELFTRTTARVDYGFSIGATRVSLSAALIDNDFEDLPRDEESRSLNLTLSRALRPNLNASVNINHQDSEFDQLPAAAFDQLFVTAGVFWEPIRNTQVILRAQYIDRSGEALSGNFDETRIYAGVTYTFGTGPGMQQTLRAR